METRLNSENKTKGEAFASQNTHKDFATDLDSDGYLILPKTLGVYNFYSVNDFLAGLLVFLPSIVAALAVEANQQRDWAITLSKLTVLAQVAWMVIFITSWPLAWIRHLEKSGIAKRQCGAANTRGGFKQASFCCKLAFGFEAPTIRKTSAIVVVLCHRGKFCYDAVVGCSFWQ